ncbi:hypothetical protein LINPERHAP1_LOCUS38003 [Linum perenne]
MWQTGSWFPSRRILAYALSLE